MTFSIQTLQRATSEVGNCNLIIRIRKRRTDNTMAKRKRTKGRATQT